ERLGFRRARGRRQLDRVGAALLVPPPVLQVHVGDFEEAIPDLAALLDADDRFLVRAWNEWAARERHGAVRIGRERVFRRSVENLAAVAGAGGGGVPADARAGERLAGAVDEPEVVIGRDVIEEL